MFEELGIQPMLVIRCLASCAATAISPLSGSSAGGGGGSGVLVTVAGAVLSNGGTITGGNGGSGALLNAAGTVTNSGTITGGAGGSGGGAGSGGANVAITNSGTIAGGYANAGSGAQADAILFSGGVNSLTLEAGSFITGNVVAVAGGSDTLILGGATNASFDVSQIGASGQYQNFAAFEKTGAGTWTLSNTTTATTPWTISAGTLAVGSLAALGSGAVTIGVELDGSGGSGQLAVNGTVTGATTVNVSNLAASSAPTNGNGILLITTNGGSGTFQLPGGNPVTVGGISYQLAQVGNNWYLQSPTSTVTWPTAGTIAYGQTLASSALTGGSAMFDSTTVPGTFAWTVPTTVPGVGTLSESVTFTPTNTADYAP